MQYPIPQFIEQEGKIVFFLTYRQFFLLVGGGIACALIYAITPFWLFAILSFIIMTIIAGIAFLKINGMPILTVLLHYAGFTIAPKTYTWEKAESTYPFKIRAGKPGRSNEDAPMTVQGSKLSEIKKIVETTKK